MLCFFALFFSLTSQAQTDTLKKSRGRGPITALNWGTDVNPGIGYTFLNNKGIDLNISYFLWYRIIRRYGKRMCDHQWFATAAWSPANNNTLKFRLGDLWLRSPRWESYRGIRAGPVAEMSISSGKNNFSIGTEVLGLYNPLALSVRFLWLAGGKFNEIQLGLSLAYKFRLNRRYSCGR